MTDGRPQLGRRFRVDVESVGQGDLRDLGGVGVGQQRRIDVERDRHLHPLASLQGLLLETETVHLGEIRADLEWSHVVDGATDHGTVALVDRLIQSGDAEALLEEGRTIWVPLPAEPGETWLHLDRPGMPALDVVAGAWLDALRSWLREWPQSPGFERVREAIQKRRCHILPVGRPFQDSTFKDRLKQILRDTPLFRDVRAYCHTEAEGLVATGAAAFLRRQHAGVPTWEDWLPALHLEVVGEGGFLEYIPVFEERRVRPGEEILFRTDGERYPLTLPAGRPSYYFPLVRNLESRTPLAYDARLRHPAFPLREPVPVRLEVAYAYGADSYRLVVCPRAAVAPFRSIPVEWTRGEEGREAEQEHVPNLAPEFPSEPWSAVPSGSIHDFVKMASSLHRRADTLFPPDNLEGVEPSRFAEDIANYTDKWIRWAYGSSRALWARGRTREGAPEEVLQALDDTLFPWLCWFAGLSTVVHTSPALERCRGTEVDDAMQKLQLQAWWVLTRFNADAPPEFIPALVPELRSRDRDARDRAFRWLGRILGDGTGPRQDGLEAILQACGAASGRDLRELRSPVQALATALWLHPRLVYSLAELAAVDMVLRVLDEGFQRLITLLDGEDSERWMKGMRGLFRSLSEALLGLLRLRNTPHAESLRSGNRWMRAMARNIRILDSIFVRAGLTCDSYFRFSLPSSEHQRQLSDLAYVLVSYLTGEEGVSNIHIEAMSDEDS